MSDMDLVAASIFENNERKVALVAKYLRDGDESVVGVP
jgi:hypothetical protein